MTLPNYHNDHPSSTPGCAFCDIIHNAAIAGVVRPKAWEEHPEYVVFEPLAPVTPGHRLVVPRRHVPDAGYDWSLTGRMFEAACAVANNHLRARPEYNLIVNKGEAAGQTIMHLHIHIVPRTLSDGLVMPWDLERYLEEREADRMWEGSDDW